jgi:transcription termination/antitermination protein NusA
VTSAGDIIARFLWKEPGELTNGRHPARPYQRRGWRKQSVICSKISATREDIHTVSNLLGNIDIISKEKGIESQVIVEAVRDAMLVAARKQYKTQEDLGADFDPRTGDVLIFAIKQVVETVEDPVNQWTLAQARQKDPQAEIGSEVRVFLPTEGLGRIAAQTAKQVIMQKIREAERETLFREFNDRIGEMTPCTVKRLEGSDIVVDIGKSEARMPKREQSRLESFSVGDRIRVVVKAVDKTGKNPGVIVSRADPDFVVRLFEQEVPEIYDGTVEVKACAREAGERTKIAVLSRDRDVDSVGACVGMKGMRVQSIIRELRGEKIDIIEFSEDPKTFATNALSPAKISRVAIVDTEARHMEVIVDDTQLSLAIGKKGQNVRLAAKLLGWRIDIKSQEEKRQEVELEMSNLVVPGDPVSVLLSHGLPEAILNLLVEGGVGTVEQLGSMTPEELTAIPGMLPDYIPMIQSAVLSYYSQFENALLDESAEQPEGADAEAVSSSLEDSAAEDSAPNAEVATDGSTPAGETTVDEAHPAVDVAADTEAPASALEPVSDVPSNVESPEELDAGGTHSGQLPTAAPQTDDLKSAAAAAEISDVVDAGPGTESALASHSDESSNGPGETTKGKSGDAEEGSPDNEDASRAENRVE